MLVFVISLRSRAVSKDWDRVIAQCQRTVASCCAQKHPDFKVIVVCSDPIDLPADPRLTIIQDVFPVPQDREQQMHDKYRKIQRGLLHAREWAPFHWMKVDADDLVSNRLADVVASSPESFGWFFPSGYIHAEGESRVYRQGKDFDRFCGTSSILLCQSPDSMPDSMEQPLTDFPLLSVPHHDLAAFMSGAGTPLRALPFPGAMYCTGTGENWSGFGGVEQYRSIRWTLRRLFNYRRLTQSIRNEFGLTELHRELPL